MAEPLENRYYSVAIGGCSAALGGFLYGIIGRDDLYLLSPAIATMFLMSFSLYLHKKNNKKN